LVVQGYFSNLWQHIAVHISS